MLPGGSRGSPGRSGAGQSRGGAGVKPAGSRAWLGWSGGAPCGDEPEQRPGHTGRVRAVSAGLVAID